MSSCVMATQADQKTTSAIRDFMRSLHESKAEWGIFHMLVAQTVLNCLIYLAGTTSLVGECCTATSFFRQCLFSLSSPGSPLQQLAGNASSASAWPLQPRSGTVSSDSPCVGSCRVAFRLGLRVLALASHRGHLEMYTITSPKCILSSLSKPLRFKPTLTPGLACSS